jgi:hypothetical protein
MPTPNNKLVPIAIPAATRRRYSDRRTAEGKKLQAVQDSIVASVGGQEMLNAPQAILLASIASKLIIMWEISVYLDGGAIVDGQGELSPCVSKGFCQYSNALRQDLVAFYGLSRFQIRRERLPKIEDLIKANVESDE